MTNKESRRLKSGDGVRFSDGVKGQVTEVWPDAIGISWDDGQVGLIHRDDMQDVSQAKVAA